MIGLKVAAMWSGGLQMGRICQVVELAWGRSASNRATHSSYRPLHLYSYVLSSMKPFPVEEGMFWGKISLRECWPEGCTWASPPSSPWQEAWTPNQPGKTGIHWINLKTSPGPEPQRHPPEQGGRGLLSQRRTNWWSSVNVILQFAFQKKWS